METYILLKDFNWFGEIIEKGAIYKRYKSTKDKFRCFTINGNECPVFDLNFMTVRNNPEYFMELNTKALSAAFIK